MSKEINNINNILDLVIDDIHRGKEKILNITESLKDQYDKDSKELEIISRDIEVLKEEVNILEVSDKQMREELARASMNFQKDETEVKEIYEKALNVRVEFLTKQKEEKRLQSKREALQKSLGQNHENISEADSVVEHISVVLNYLKGDVFNKFEMAEENSKMAYSIRFVEAQENEKNRIARDIHDGPAQYLASSLMRIDFCKMLLTKNLNDGINELEDLKLNLKKTLKEVRGIIFDLKPPCLNGVTLANALEDLVEVFQEECSADIKIHIRDNDCILDYVIEVAVYRIIQEILTNVKKHAEAFNVSLKIEITEMCVYINIKDDGKGFDIDTLMKRIKDSKGKYGILGIYDRVDEFGGTIQINSKINCGTEYKIKLPAIRGRDEG